MWELNEDNWDHAASSFCRLRPGAVMQCRVKVIREGDRWECRSVHGLSFMSQFLIDTSELFSQEYSVRLIWKALLVTPVVYNLLFK